MMRARMGYTRRDGTGKSNVIRTTKSYRYYCPPCPICTCIGDVLRPPFTYLNRQQYINFNVAIHAFIDKIADEQRSKERLNNRGNGRKIGNARKPSKSNGKNNCVGVSTGGERSLPKTRESSPPPVHLAPVIANGFPRAHLTENVQLFGL